MPKVKIVEKDLTGSLQLREESNVVYIPGLGAAAGNPVLINNLAELKEELKAGGKLNGADENCHSLKLAKRLLKLGMPVLYQLFVGTTQDTPVEGEFFAPIEIGAEDKQVFTVNGVVYTIEENNKVSYESSSSIIELDIVNGTVDLGEVTIGTETVESVMVIDFLHGMVKYNVKEIRAGSLANVDAQVWRNLQDRTLYDIRFLTAGAYPEAVSMADMIECAAKRGDCVALVDHTKELNDSSVTAIIEYFKQFGLTTITKNIFGEDVTIKTAAFAAGFTPWFKTEEDTVDAESLEVPASFGYLFAYARMVQENPSWYACAGSFRGNIPELKEVLKEYTNAEVERLQARAEEAEVELDGFNDNVGVAINPIALVEPFGHILWGNRTLVKNERGSDTQGILTATSFLNIRNLVSLINKKAYDAARKYTFEQNNNVLWVNFKSEIIPLLDKMQTGNGILGYKIEKVETNKRARLGAKIRIIPIEGVEDFEIEIDLQNSISE